MAPVVCPIRDVRIGHRVRWAGRFHEVVDMKPSPTGRYLILRVDNGWRELHFIAGARLVVQQEHATP